MNRDKIIEVMARGICRRRLDDNIVGDVSEDEIRAYVDETWRLFESDASAALTAYESHLHAKGLVVVPVEPTEAMHDAARDWSALKYGKPIGTDASKGCWAAMLAASQEKDA